MGSKINDIMIRSSSVGIGRKSMNSSFNGSIGGSSQRSVNSDFNKSFNGVKSNVLSKNKGDTRFNRADLKAEKHLLLN